MNSYSYYDISDTCYVKLNFVMETMKEQYECFLGEMRECSLLLETDPSPSSPRLEFSLYDDYEFSLPLEPNITVDSPLIGLEKVTDPPLLSSPFVTTPLSSTPRNSTEGVLSLLSPTLPFAQCTGLEMCESSMSDASFVKDDLLD